MSGSDGRPGLGIVYLVGAGPGDPGLLTLRAAELLRTADVVAHDELVSSEILALAPSSAERLAVGRRQGSGRIDYRLHPDVLDRARRGLRVVRLKSGDPLIFGRGGEEAEVLVENGIPFEIVPGISAALGAAAYAGIPLTHRHVSAGVLLTTGHEADDEASGDEPVVLVAPRAPGMSPAADRTLVLYMAARRVRSTLQRLIKEGFAGDTPAAYVASATTPAQEVVVGTVADLADRITAPSSSPSRPRPRPPGLLIIGEVVRLRARLAWFEQRRPKQP